MSLVGCVGHVARWLAKFWIQFYEINVAMRVVRAPVAHKRCLKFPSYHFMACCQTNCWNHFTAIASNLFKVWPSYAFSVSVESFIAIWPLIAIDRSNPNKIWITHHTKKKLRLTKTINMVACDKSERNAMHVNFVPFFVSNDWIY